MQKIDLKLPFFKKLESLFRGGKCKTFKVSYPMSSRLEAAELEKKRDVVTYEKCKVCEALDMDAVEHFDLTTKTKWNSFAVLIGKKMVA